MGAIELVAVNVVKGLLELGPLEAGARLIFDATNGRHRLHSAKGVAGEEQVCLRRPILRKVAAPEEDVEFKVMGHKRGFTLTTILREPIHHLGCRHPFAPTLLIRQAVGGQRHWVDFDVAAVVDQSAERGDFIKALVEQDRRDLQNDRLLWRARRQVEGRQARRFGVEDEVVHGRMKCVFFCAPPAFTLLPITPPEDTNWVGFEPTTPA